MKRKNTTRSALLTSIISLLLCVSMLVGTTFAWFTDEVKSGTNLIAAGNLDVEVYNGLDAKAPKVTTDTKLFDEITYWEPGVVAYENLTVANLGNLALKYQLAVNFTDATTNAKGDTLAKVLKVGFVKGGIQSGTREGALDEVSVWLPLESFVQSGKLLPKEHDHIKNAPADAAVESETYGIVIYWQPSDIDNEFNMNNENRGKVMSINLGIKLLATQLEAEDDSFGEDYDGGAPWVTMADTNWYFENPDATEFTISSAEELAGLAALVNGTATAPVTTFAADSNATVKDSFAGKTIKLSSDIDLANKAWTPIGNFVYDISTNGDGYTEGASFQGTFDGQGHTISNLYINAPETSGIGLFGCVKGATIKGVTVKNAKLNGLSHVAAIVARSFTYNVNTTVTDCHLTGEIELNAYWAYLGGIVGKASALTLTNCSVIPEGTGSITSENRNAVGSVLGWIENASTITNCKAQNMNLTGWANIGGITGFVSGGSIVEGCSAENIILTKTRADGHPSIGLVSGGWNGKPITLKNNTVKNVTLIGNFIAGSETNILHGADFYGSMDNSGFILENNTTENITNNLGEVTRITDGLVQKKDGTYQIYNAAGLSSLSGAKISGTYALIADIDLGGAEFKAMSAWYKSATFIGNGHTISNVKIVSGENDNGTEQASLFFVSTNGSLTVSDLTVKDITVTTKNVDNGYAAAIIGYCEGAAVLDNVDVVNATVTGSKSSGLVIGHLTPAGSLTATDCDVTGSVTVSDYEANGHYAGKLIGTIAGNVALNNVTYKATIGGNLNAKNVGDIYGRQVSGSLTVDGAKVASDAASLKEGLAAGEDVVLATDVNTEAATTAPYGNKYAVKLDGGVLDGNGHELYMECYGDDYGIMTTGGTIKNITIQEGCRAVMIMYPTQDIIIDNANIGGDGVLYPINTGEAGAAGVKLIVTNSTLAGWTSYGLIESASFTNVKFEQGTYYNNIYGRVLKPYVNTTLTNCSFVAHMNLDLSALGQGQKITMVNCTVDGQPVNAATFTIPSTDAEYDTELFTVDLPSWASSINDCIVFG